MKQSLLKYSALFIGFTLLVLIGNSCNNKSSDCNVPCYFGSCVNNACNCSNGYEGDSCSVRTVDKFIGDWDAYDSCMAKDFSYVATIAGSSSVTNQILITNFGEFGTSFVVYANISGFNFTIPNQAVQGVTVNGAGVIDTITKQIAVTFSVVDEFHNSDSCSGIWKKKQ